MIPIILNNIDNSFESYQKLIDFHEKCKNLEYEDISVKIEFWFAANMSSALGGICDKLLKKLNNVF